MEISLCYFDGNVSLSGRSTNVIILNKREDSDLLQPSNLDKESYLKLETKTDTKPDTSCSEQSQVAPRTRNIK